MAKQLVDTGLVANDGTGDPIRTAMTKVNENTTEIYNALGGDTLTNLVNSSGEIELLSTANKISFLYNTEAEVLALDTTTHHGVVAHAHDTGALYYCHGEWRKLLTDNSGADVTSYTDPLDLHSYADNVTNSGAATQVLVSNGDGTFTWSNQSGGGGGAITIEDEGVALSTDATALNFVGAGVTATGNGTTKTITISGGGGGGSSLDLTDTPSSYGTAGQSLVVNSGADGLEFATVSTASVSMTTLTDTDISNVQTNQVLKWNGNDWQNFDLNPTFAGLTDQPAAPDQQSFENIWKNASTVLTVSANGSTAYRFDQYGTTDNPTIYVKAGTTIGFDLSYDQAGTHPFKIQTTGGSDIADGIFELTSGNVYNDFTQGGAYGGTLFWKVPASFSGNYQYICTAHGGMIGTIVVEAAAGGGGSTPSRSTSNGATSGTHANNTDENLDITGFKSYSLFKIATDRAAWVRLYITSAKRTADASRLQTQDPAATAGVIAEVVTTGAETVDFTPAALGWNGDGTPGTTIYAAVRNLSGSTSAVDVTLTLLQLES
jgi:plastocyanin